MTSILAMLAGLGLVVLGLVTWRRRGRHILGLLLGIFLVLFGALTIWVGSNLAGQYTTISEPACQWSGSPVPGMPWCDDATG